MRILLFFIFLSTMLSATAQNYSGGSGSEEDPYQIANFIDLVYLSNHSLDWDNNFVQTADIDASASYKMNLDSETVHGFSPIGSFSIKFTGSYDGDYYRISNLFIEEQANLWYIGLFSYINDAELSGIQLNNANISGIGSTGGIAGHIAKSQITDCSVSGTISSDELFGAGIVGECSSSVSEPNTIKNCVNYATIKSNYSCFPIAGSFNQKEPLVIKNCYNAGLILPGVKGGGTIFGYCSTQCYNSGYSDLLQYESQDVEYYSSNKTYWVKDLCSIMRHTFTEETNNVIEVINSAQLKDPAVFKNWGIQTIGDVDNPWQMENDSYPYLYFEPVVLQMASPSVEVVDNNTIHLHIDTILLLNHSEDYFSNVYIEIRDASDLTTQKIQLKLDGQPYTTKTFQDILIPNLDRYKGYYLRVVAEQTEGALYFSNHYKKHIYFSQGDGTAEKPFGIETYRDLLTLSSNLEILDAHYILLNDIECTDQKFSPIGDLDNPFTGTFDGKNHAIRNLTCIENDNYGIALFKRCIDSKILNLKLDNIDMQGRAYVSTVAYQLSNSLVENIRVTGTIKASQVGASSLVSIISDNSKIINCKSNALVSAVTNTAGGLFNVISDSELKNCFFDGAVKSNLNVGGLGNTINKHCTISNSISTGVFISNREFGGLFVNYDYESQEIQIVEGLQNLYYNRDAANNATAFYNANWGSGSALYSTEIGDPASFVGWNFKDMPTSEHPWGHLANNRPYLFNESCILTVKHPVNNAEEGEEPSLQTYPCYLSVLRGDPIVEWGIELKLSQEDWIKIESHETTLLAGEAQELSAIDLNSIDAKGERIFRYYAIDSKGSRSESNLILSSKLFSGGSGSKEDPFIISTANDLIDLSKNQMHWNGFFYKQVNDINLSITRTLNIDSDGIARGFSPILFENGGYEGNGYRIDSLYINRTEGSQGLFSALKSSLLRNLRLENVDITGGYRTGAFAGVVEGYYNSTIENLSSSGIVRGLEYSGGLFGDLEVPISNCFSSCTVLASGLSGGLIGKTFSTHAITNSYFSGLVQGSYSFLGRDYGSTLVENCYSNGASLSPLGAGFSFGRMGHIPLNSYVNIEAARKRTNNSYLMYLSQYDCDNMAKSENFSNWKTMEDSPWDIIDDSYPAFKWQSFQLSLFSPEVTSSEERFTILFPKSTFWNKTEEYHCFKWGYQIFDTENLSWKEELIGEISSEAKLQFKLPEFSISNLENDSVHYVRIFARSTTNSVYSNVISFKQGYSGGIGSEEDPYLIASDQDLQELSNSNSDMIFNFKQIADISGQNLTTIPSFSGVYDGQGYTIENYFILATEESDSDIGLFSELNNAVVNDLNLENISVEGYNFVGMLAGRVKNSNINNVRASGAVRKLTTRYNGFGNIGGVFGTVTTSNLQNICFNGSVRGEEYVGGIAGSFSGNNSYQNLTTTGYIEGTTCVGGIVGVCKDKLSSCVSSALVVGETKVGGIVGTIADSNPKIENCVFAGGVHSYSLGGGILGTWTKLDTWAEEINEEYWVKNCFVSGDVVGKDNTGGVLGYTNQETLVGYVDNSYFNFSSTKLEYQFGYYNHDLDKFGVALFGNEIQSEQSYQGWTFSEYPNSDSSWGLGAAPRPYLYCENVILSSGVLNMEREESSSSVQLTDGLLFNRGKPNIVEIGYQYQKGKPSAEWEIIQTESTNILESETQKLPALAKSKLAFNLDHRLRSYAKDEEGTIYYGEILRFNNRYSGGNGSSDSPFQIKTYDDLSLLLENPFDWNADFIQTGNITCTSNLNTTIGSKTDPFKGSYNGQEFAISNLSIYNTDEGTGLFGYTKGANLSFINLINTKITGYENVGGLVGEAANTFISHCNVLDNDTASIKDRIRANHYITGSFNIGGLAGKIDENSTIENSSTQFNIYSCWKFDLTESAEYLMNGHGSVIGGIVGDNAGTISNTSSASYIAGYSAVGGFVGVNSGTILNSKSSGYVNAIQAGAGFVCAIEGGLIKGCYSNTGIYSSSDASSFSRNISNNDAIGNQIEYCYTSGYAFGTNKISAFSSDYYSPSYSLHECYLDSTICTIQIGDNLKQSKAIDFDTFKNEKKFNSFYDNKELIWQYNEYGRPYFTNDELWINVIGVKQNNTIPIVSNVTDFTNEIIRFGVRYKPFSSAQFKKYDLPIAKDEAVVDMDNIHFRENVLIQPFAELKSGEQKYGEMVLYDPHITIYFYDENQNYWNRMAPIETFVNDETIIESYPTQKVGYKFAGFSTLENSNEASYKLNEAFVLTELKDILLYPVWEKEKYTVSFDANEGVGQQDSLVVEYEEYLVFPEVTFSNTKGQFLGWSLSNSKSYYSEVNSDPSVYGVLYQPGDEVCYRNTTNGKYYAIWDDGSFNSIQTFFLGECLTKPDGFNSYIKKDASILWGVNYFSDCYLDSVCMNGVNITYKVNQYTYYSQTYLNYNDDLSNKNYVFNVYLNDDSPTPVEKIEGLNLTVYPNPASEYVIMRSEKPVDLKLYNNSGVLIDSFLLDSELLYTVDQLNPGIYYLQTTDDGTKQNWKLIIR